MATLQITTHPDFEARMAKYPEEIVGKMQQLRAIVLETAEKNPEIDRLGETLKWGEPSFVTPDGSTLRMDWKVQTPNHYALYFQCTSKLVHTFKLVFGSTFDFEGNRAIVLPLNAKLPKPQLMACINATLMYHKVKHLPTLGI